MSYKWTRVKPHTPTSYLMMPYQNMVLPMMNLVGWVGGKFKDSGCALSSTPSSILLSDFSNEHIRNPSKALLMSLLLKSCTRLQHPFV
jgi:hypothetical protein